MSQTIALSPTTDAAESSDIVVDTGPVSVVVYGPGRVWSARLERKIGAAWYPAGFGLSNSTITAVAIAAPGTYRVVKSATHEAVGVAVDR